MPPFLVIGKNRGKNLPPTVRMLTYYFLAWEKITKTHEVLVFFSFFKTVIVMHADFDLFLLKDACISPVWF